MKFFKRLIFRAFENERTLQVIFVLGALPGIFNAIWKHDFHLMAGIGTGFNLGAALYYGLVIKERARARRWMEEAMHIREQAMMLHAPSRSQIEKVVNAAKALVKARMRSEGIDPERN